MNWGLQALVIMPETAREKIKSRGAKLDFTQTAATVALERAYSTVSRCPIRTQVRTLRPSNGGRQGGLKGGEARAKKLTPIAKHPWIIPVKITRI